VFIQYTLIVPNPMQLWGVLSALSLLITHATLLFYFTCTHQPINIHQVYQPMLLSHHCLHLLALLCMFYSVYECSAPFEPSRLIGRVATCWKNLTT
jgi:hypothetical protein